jgi:hypothetical protein
MLLLLVTVGMSVTFVQVSADDTAIEIAAGGIEWLREPRIRMVKERLTISLEKVIVEFEFLNESDHDIAIQVGFPVPEYDSSYGNYGGNKSFDYFDLQVDGKPFKYETEARAFLTGVDHSKILRKSGIDIGTFGGWQGEWEGGPDPNAPLMKLAKEKKEQLLKLGLLDKNGCPLWSVRKTYHWTQRYPAHKIVRIRHQYSPVIGYSPDFLGSGRMCLDDDLAKRMDALSAKEDHYFPTYFVQYILTSANTWKTPLGEFELIVDKASFKDDGYVSFCWPGKIEKLDETRLIARAKDFVPSKDLTVYFFEVRPR